MPIKLTERALRRVFPHARASYIAALLDNQDFLDRYGIKDDAERWCQFCGQIGGETDGLRIVRESMTYTSASRIRQIFGRRHSAKVTSSEAQHLVRNPVALAERVYGLGNPSMARRLGNDQDGDGYNYRGWGPGQVTGKGQTLEYGEALGLDLEANPELLEDPAVGLKAFVLEWEHRGLNEWASRGDLLAVSRGVNLGNPRHRATPNGLDHRRRWNRKAWAEWRSAPTDGSTPKSKPASIMVVRKGDSGAQVKALQERLYELGYPVGNIDNDFGTLTRRAVASFQLDHDLAADGIVGPKTWDALRTAEPVVLSAREETTPTDLAERGSRTIALAWSQKTRGLKTIATGLVVGLTEFSFPSTISAIPEWISNLRHTSDGFQAAYDYVATPTGAVVVSCAVLIGLGAMFWRDGKVAEEIRVDDAQTGANLGR